MENNDFASRRKHVRHTLGTIVEVYDRSTGKPVGAIANLSLEGLMLVNSEPLMTESLYQLGLQIGEGVIPGREALEILVGVDCLWNSPGVPSEASIFWSGCQIIDISDRDFELVRQLLDSTVE